MKSIFDLRFLAFDWERGHRAAMGAIGTGWLAIISATPAFAWKLRTGRLGSRAPGCRGLRSFQVQKRTKGGPKADKKPPLSAFVRVCPPLGRKVFFGIECWSVGPIGREALVGVCRSEKNEQRRNIRD